jgi:RNA polymerase sigma-70 factor, ECF subfamily
MTGAQAEDAALVVRLHEGDPVAAREVYQRHGPALLRFGVAMVGCIATAEDVVHDTFVELLRHPHRYDAARGSLRAYLYGVARHQLARSLRISGRYISDAPCSRDLESEPEEPERVPLSGVDSTLEEQVDRAQALERVRAAIRALPPHYREVVALCDIEELSYAVVAEIIRCPVGTVRSRLHRARALLASEFAGLDGSLNSSASRGSPDPGDGNSRQACAAMALTLSAKGTTT